MILLFFNVWRFDLKNVLRYVYFYGKIIISNQSWVGYAKIIRQKKYSNLAAILSQNAIVFKFMFVFISYTIYTYTIRHHGLK